MSVTSARPDSGGQVRGHAMTGNGRGTDGNERLTALTGSLLFVLLAVEGVTIVALHNAADRRTCSSACC